MAVPMFTSSFLRAFRSLRRYATATGTSDSETLQVYNKAGVRTLCLNDTKKRNALSLDMLHRLEKAILPIDNELRVIVIKATGSVFSAGHDLKELTTARGKAYQSEVFEKCTDVMKLIQDIPIPVIAQVNGLATAAGCQLVATCDVAIASDKSKFAMPGALVGLFCSTPAVAVARTVPTKIAMEMLLTGDPISAQDALAHGLVSRVVPEEQLDEQVQTIANKICSKSRSVIALGKSCFYKQIGQGRDAAYRTAVQAMVSNLQLRDGQEGIASFAEKRKPVWKHTDEGTS